MTRETTPLKAIRQKCLECAERPKDVRYCLSTDCPLHPYRFGHNPARKGIGPGLIKKSSIESSNLTNKGGLNA